MRPLIYIACILGFNLSVCSEDRWEDAPITGDDLVELMELKINKYVVEFDEPKLVTLHFESFCQSQKWSLELPQSKVSVSIYDPKENPHDQAPGIGGMTLRIKGESHGGSILSYGTYEKHKVKFQTIRYRNGLEIIAKESKEAEDFVFRLWVTAEAP